MKAIYTEDNFSFEQMLKYAFGEMNGVEEQAFEDFLDTHPDYAEMASDILSTCQREGISGKEDYLKRSDESKRMFREETAAKLNMTPVAFENYNLSKKKPASTDEGKVVSMPHRLSSGKRWLIAASVVLLVGLSAWLFRQMQLTGTLQRENERLSQQVAEQQKNSQAREVDYAKLKADLDKQKEQLDLAASQKRADSIKIILLETRLREAENKVPIPPPSIWSAFMPLT